MTESNKSVASDVEESATLANDPLLPVKFKTQYDSIYYAISKIV